MSTAVASPLHGVKILDMSRLAPGPYASMLLSDLGAEVISIGGGRAGLPLEQVMRGKTVVNLNLKTDAGRRAFHALVRESDVVLESFRPGVVDRLGAGYEELRAINPRIIHCSLTGYGQTGPLAHSAGHDINYLSLTGVLGSIGPADGPPLPPLNLVADFAGGSLFAVIAILGALVERERSGEGQAIDVSMVDGVRSMMTMHYALWGSAAMPDRGTGIIAGGAPFYTTYECADGRFVAVGAMEPQFFAELWRVLDLGDPPPQYPESNWPIIGRQLRAKFLTKSRDEWESIFDGVDACVSPVLLPDEVSSRLDEVPRPRETAWMPPALPKYSRTVLGLSEMDLTDRTVETLEPMGMSDDEIAEAHFPIDRAAKEIIPVDLTDPSKAPGTREPR